MRKGLCRDGVRKQAQALVYRSTANAGSSGPSEATGPELSQHNPQWPRTGSSTFRSCDSVSSTSGGPTSRPSSRPVALFLYVTLPRYRMAESTEKILGEKRRFDWGSFHNCEMTEASSQLG